MNIDSLDDRSEAIKEGKDIPFSDIPSHRPVGDKTGGKAR